jgi:hypothetical protein
LRSKHTLCYTTSMAPKTKKLRSEHQEQVRFASVLRAFYPECLWFAVPNGGQRLPKEAVRLKAEGVRAGVCDLFVSQAYGEHHGLYIEMKKAEGGVTSDKQIDFMQRATKNGYKCVVALGAEQALEMFQDYFEISEDERIWFP